MMPERSQRQRDLVDRAEALMNGSAGAFKLPSDYAVVIDRGEGSKVYDVDGREFIDYLLGSGPMLIGHAHPAIVAAVQAQAAKGSTFYTLTEPTIELAERLVEAIPCAEAIKFVSSGTEATFHAMRIARTFTGKPKILKFEGGFHGVNDYALMSSSASRQTEYPKPIPDSAGIPEEVEADVLVSRWNDVELTEQILRERAGEIAAVICEPLQRALVPAPGFLNELRRMTAENDVLLIFDEIVTGFRLAYGGGQERYGVTPDLATYGKAMAGGYPMAAVAGRKEIIDTTDSARKAQGLPVSHLGGTMNGNPIAAVAGLATLDVLSEPGTYEHLYAISDRIKQGLLESADRHGETVKIVGEGPVFQAFFTEKAPFDYPDVLLADRARGRQFGLNLIANGLFLNPGEKFYVSVRHDESDLARTLEAFDRAFAALPQPAPAG
jgi:glutamate-1-semialdehyde 2,1-aminomutase